MFCGARHLPKGEIVAIWKKHRIVTKAFVAPGRPHQRTINAAFELLHMAIRPSDTQCRYEVSAAELRCYGTAIAQLTVDFPHGRRKIPVRTCPAGRVNAWRTPKGINRDPGVVRKG